MGNPSELSVSWDSSGKSFHMGAVKKKSSANSDIITCDMWSLGTTSLTTSRTESVGEMLEYSLCASERAGLIKTIWFPLPGNKSCQRILYPHLILKRCILSHFKKSCKWTHKYLCMYMYLNICLSYVHEEIYGVLKWFGLEGTIKDHLVQTSLVMDRDTFH